MNVNTTIFGDVKVVEKENDLFVIVDDVEVRVPLYAASATHMRINRGENTPEEAWRWCHAQLTN